MRKAIRIVTFYDDGTFTESIPSAPYSAMPVQPMNPTWTTANKCSKCGLEIKGTMGYVCTNYPCPVGLGGAWCSNNIESSPT